MHWFPDLLHLTIQPQWVLLVRENLQNQGPTLHPNPHLLHLTV